MSRKTVIYQMLPRLWGEGRFSSVDDASLDYLTGLGITHVWYTGVIRHSTAKPFVKGDPGSPYAICDYWDVNPYLADDESQRMLEFESLVKRTHCHGLKVVIDFVPNHLGRDYSDRHGGIPHFEWYDYDWSDTCKIDYGHPDTWEAMYRIVRFWASKGVDGFRCDMVELVPPEFFRWLIARIKGEYPGIIFIAEVYQKKKYREYVEEVGFDLLYDKSGLYDSLRALVGGHGTARAITWNWQYLGSLQPHMLNFLENHDEQRLASPWFAGSPDHMACLYASLAFNTAPFMIYSGQEIGLDAAEGHEGRTTIFNRTRPEGLERLYAHIHGADSLESGESKTLQSYRKALSTAREECVGGGLTYDLCYCQDSRGGFDPDMHFAFIRHAAEKTVLVVCNFSERESEVTIDIPRHASEYLGRPLPATVIVKLKKFGATVTTL